MKSGLLLGFPRIGIEHWLDICIVIFGTLHYLYLRADRLLAQGATVETIDLGKDERGDNHSDYRLVVRDRAMLDRAMAEFLAGTRKPVLRRYSSDMLRERLAIMGQPQSLFEQMQECALAEAAHTDFRAHRDLMRAAIAYARLLIQEGRPDEARPFIDFWQPLAVQTADDAFILVDVFCAAAAVRIGQDIATALYHEIGDAAAEARTRHVATTLYAPVVAYYARRKAHAATGEDLMGIRYGGFRSAMFVPVLDEPMTVKELETDRLLTYAMLDRTACNVANLLLFGIMIAALMVTLRWRFVRGASGASLLLLPHARQILRILGFGVILPLCAYALWTRAPLLGGRDVSLYLTWPAALPQAVILVTGIVVATMTLTMRAVRARCEILQVPTPPADKRHWLLWGVAVSCGLMLIIAQCLRPLHAYFISEDWEKIIGIFLLAFGALAALTAGIVFFRYLFGSRGFGLYRGTVARSLIPHLAMAMVLITLLTNPYLRATEARLVSGDPLMSISETKTCAGFTVIERRVTERLRTEMLKAAGK